MASIDDLKVHLDRAYAYEEEDKFEEALRECENAIELDPNLAEAYNLRGIILEDLDRSYEAIDEYREAIRLDPKFQDAIENLNSLELDLMPKQSWGPFVSSVTRSKWVIGFFALSIFLNLTAILSTYGEISLLSREMEGGTVTDTELIANDTRQQFIGITQLIVYIFALVIFLMWIHRSYRNLPALGVVGLKYSPGWAVGYFFIPILNLFRPYQTVKEIWKASDPNIDFTDNTAWRYVDTSPLIKIWWFFWIIDNSLDRFVGRMSRRADTLKGFIDADWISIISDILAVIVAVLTIIIVRTISDMQENKSKRLTMPWM